MNRKQSVSIVSVSALTAGMAQGAVTYSGLINTTLPKGSGGTVQIDLNGSAGAFGQGGINQAGVSDGALGHSGCQRGDGDDRNTLFSIHGYTSGLMDGRFVLMLGHYPVSIA